MLSYLTKVDSVHTGVSHFAPLLELGNNYHSFHIFILVSLFPINTDIVTGFYTGWSIFCHFLGNRWSISLEREELNWIPMQWKMRLIERQYLLFLKECCATHACACITNQAVCTEMPSLAKAELIPSLHACSPNTIWTTTKNWK